MRRRKSVLARVIPLSLLVALVAPASASSQATDGPQVSFTGRVHAQWATTTVDDEVSSDFFIRRARVTALVKVNDLVSGRIQPEFAGGSTSLRDAYVELAFSPAFKVKMGQFKRAFDFFELESSTRSLLIERFGGIRGVGDGSGAGAVCTHTCLTKKLRYAGRDVGLMIDGKLGDSPLSYRLSLTNGEGINRLDAASRKSYAGRVVYSISDDLNVGAGVSVHDYLNEVDTDQHYASAFGIDVDWGSYSPGLHLQGGFLSGQDWRELEADGTPTMFRATQGVVSYRFALERSPNFTGLEPVLRVSWADPNTDIASNNDLLVTAGVMLHFEGRNRVAANLEMWDPNQGTGEWSFKLQTYLHF